MNAANADGLEFNIVIDQTRMIQWDLSFREASLLAYIKQAFSRFTPDVKGRGVWLSKKMILRDMPCLTNRQDVLQRIERDLIDKGLITKFQDGSQIWYQTTEKASKWGQTTSDVDILEVREKSPEITLIRKGKSVKASSKRGYDKTSHPGMTNDHTPGMTKRHTRGVTKSTTKQLTHLTDNTKTEKREKPLPPCEPVKDKKTDPRIMPGAMTECDGQCNYEYRRSQCKLCKEKRKLAERFAKSILKYAGEESPNDVHKDQDWFKYFEIPSAKSVAKAFFDKDIRSKPPEIALRLDIMIENGQFTSKRPTPFNTAIEHADRELQKNQVAVA